MKSSLNNSQELRGEIKHLVQARASLQSNIEISGSLVKITRTLNNMKPLMTKQSEYIKNFLQSSETNDQNSKESQTRRYISRICDIVLSEVNEIISIAEGYFTIDIKSTWTRIKTQFQKSLHAQREQVDKNNIVEFLFKVMNMKQKITKQFIRSLLYRKCLLWKDLNIVNEGFVHAQKKKITKSIQDNIMNKNYAPTRPLFTIPNFDTPGQWNLSKQQVEDSSTPEFLKLLNEELQQTFKTIRNYSGLNVEQRQHQDIRRNETQVTSLRAQIEQAHLSYQILQKKYREAVSKDEKLDIVQMKEKLKLAQDALQAKDLELRELKYSYRDYTRDMASHKQKIKELEADLQKITHQEMKKLKEVELLQFSLSEEFMKINKNMSSFGTMFQFESQGKKELAKDLISSKQTIEKMAVMLGKHKKEIHLLKEQIKRLNTIIIQLGLQLKDNKNS